MKTRLIAGFLLITVLAISACQPGQAPPAKNPIPASRSSAIPVQPTPATSRPSVTPSGATSERSSIPPTQEALSFSPEKLERIPPADIMNQVGHFGGAGGSGCGFSTDKLQIEVCYVKNGKIEPYGLAEFAIRKLKKGDLISLAITYPDGSKKQQSLTAGDYFSYEFIPGLEEPLGQYLFTFATPYGTVSESLKVAIERPAVYVILEQHRLVLYGFTPRERVRIFLYEKSAAGYRLKGWQAYQLNEKGQLFLNYPETIDPIFAAVGEISGLVPYKEKGSTTSPTQWAGGDIYCPGAPPPLGLQQGDRVEVITASAPLMKANTQSGSLPRGSTIQIGNIMWAPLCINGVFWWPIECGACSWDSTLWIGEGKGKEYYIKKASSKVTSTSTVTIQARCPPSVGDTVQVGENARLWSKPDVTTGSFLVSLDPNAAVKVAAGPVKGRVRTDADVSDWWWQVSTVDQVVGWLWQTRLKGCESK